MPAKEAGRARPRNTPAEPVANPAESARAAGLRYVTDAKPGISRRKFRNGFRYLLPGGAPVREAATLARIRFIVIPPAWTQVWICPLANGHLQATGRDARGRKQSRYHARWRAARNETKYERMQAFAAALPGIRLRVDQDLALPGLPRRKVLAAVIRLMETTYIRIGNQEYARENRSYGLTTLRHRHVEVQGSRITFTFQGKSRVHHTVDLTDRRLANIVKRCVDLPGYELFQYVDPEGEPHSIDSGDVNDYLHEIAGEQFTAKDFRTWAGSVLTVETLGELAPFTTAGEAKQNVVHAIAAVAKRLGNTPSVCRKCYVHPAVLEAYMGGISPARAKRKLEEELVEHTGALRREEQALVHLLEQRLLLGA